jgi:hypothetical protein
MFEIKIDSKEVQKRFNDMFNTTTKLKPSIIRDISYAYRDALRDSASESFDYPRPNLVTKIIANKKGADWIVTMPVYGKFVDVGRSAGKMPPLSPEIKRWAAKAGIDVFWLRASIGGVILKGRKHGGFGTQSRPFVDDGLSDGTDKTEEILKDYGNKIIGGK